MNHCYDGLMTKLDYRITIQLSENSFSHRVAQALENRNVAELMELAFSTVQNARCCEKERVERSTSRSVARRVDRRGPLEISPA